MQTRLRVAHERSPAAGAAAAAAVGAAVRRRALDLFVAHLAREDCVDALGSSIAAEVEALCGEVAIELAERRQRGSDLHGQQGRQQQARRVVFGHLGLAGEERAEGVERVERARETQVDDGRSRRRVAVREASVEVPQHGREHRDSR